jgi:hypothetical protein
MLRTILVDETILRTHAEGLIEVPVHLGIQAPLRPIRAQSCPLPIPAAPQLPNKISSRPAQLSGRTIQTLAKTTPRECGHFFIAGSASPLRLDTARLRRGEHRGHCSPCGE